MEAKNAVLLVGASGQLGSDLIRIIGSSLLRKRTELDVTQSDAIAIA